MICLYFHNNYPIYYNKRFENKMIEILTKRRKIRENSRNKHTLIITKMLSKSKNDYLNKLPFDVLDIINHYLTEECVYCKKYNIDLGLSHEICDCKFYKRCQCMSCQRGTKCYCTNCKNNIRLSPYFTTDCDGNQTSLIPFKHTPIDPKFLVNLHDISYNDETGERGLYHIPVHFPANGDYSSIHQDDYNFSPHPYNNYEVKDIKEGDDYNNKQMSQWIEWYAITHSYKNHKKRIQDFIESRR